MAQRAEGHKRHCKGETLGAVADLEEPPDLEPIAASVSPSSGLLFAAPSRFCLCQEQHKDFTMALTQREAVRSFTEDIRTCSF